MTHPLIPFFVSLAFGSGSFVVLAAKYVAVVQSAAQRDAPTPIPPPVVPPKELRKDDPQPPSDPNPGPSIIATPNTPRNALPTISQVPDQTLQLGGKSIAVSFDVDDKETPAKSLQVAMTRSNSWVNIALTGDGVNRTVTVTPTWFSGTTTITLTATDADGGTATRKFTVRVGSERLPPGVNWMDGDGKVLILVAGSKLNPTELKDFRDEMDKVREQNRNRLLGGHVFVVGPTRVWKCDEWIAAMPLDVFVNENPEEAFVETFRRVGMDLTSIRAGRSFQAFVPWHSLITPTTVPVGVPEIAGARLYWTGENDVLQLQNKPTHALFGNRVNGLGPNLKELGKNLSP